MIFYCFVSFVHLLSKCLVAEKKNNRVKENREEDAVVYRIDGVPGSFTFFCIWCHSSRGRASRKTRVSVLNFRHFKGLVVKTV